MPTNNKDFIVRDGIQANNAIFINNIAVNTAIVGGVVQANSTTLSVSNTIITSNSIVLSNTVSKIIVGQNAVNIDSSSGGSIKVGTTTVNSTNISLVSSANIAFGSVTVNSTSYGGTSLNSNKLGGVIASDYMNKNTEYSGLPSHKFGTGTSNSSVSGDSIYVQSTLGQNTVITPIQIELNSIVSNTKIRPDNILIKNTSTTTNIGPGSVKTSNTTSNTTTTQTGITIKSPSSVVGGEQSTIVNSGQIVVQGSTNGITTPIPIILNSDGSQQYIQVGSPTNGIGDPRYVTINQNSLVIKDKTVNDTANVYVDSSIIKIANTTANVTVDPTKILISRGATTTTIASDKGTITNGSNTFYADSNLIKVSSSTSNTTIDSTNIVVGNQTTNTVINRGYILSSNNLGYSTIAPIQFNITTPTANSKIYSNAFLLAEGTYSTDLLSNKISIKNNGGAEYSTLDYSSLIVANTTYSNLLTPKTITVQDSVQNVNVKPDSVFVGNTTSYIAISTGPNTQIENANLVIRSTDMNTVGFGNPFKYPYEMSISGSKITFKDLLNNIESSININRYTGTANTVDGFIKSGILKYPTTEIVRTTTNQTIAGQKTFSNNVIAPKLENISSLIINTTGQVIDLAPLNNTTIICRTNSIKLDKYVNNVALPLGYNVKIINWTSGPLVVQMLKNGVVNQCVSSVITGGPYDSSFTAKASGAVNISLVTMDVDGAFHATGDLQ